jgi:competence protein ComEA
MAPTSAVTTRPTRIALIRPGHTAPVAANDNAPRLVNLNSASVDELKTLPMIGSGRAEAIVAYRKQEGNFATVEDLKHVHGIGARTVNAIRHLVTVGGG